MWSLRLSLHMVGFLRKPAVQQIKSKCRVSQYRDEARSPGMISRKSAEAAPGAGIGQGAYLPGAGHAAGAGGDDCQQHLGHALAPHLPHAGCLYLKPPELCTPLKDIATNAKGQGFFHP